MSDDEDDPFATVEAMLAGDDAPESEPEEGAPPRRVFNAPRFAPPRA